MIADPQGGTRESNMDVLREFESLAMAGRLDLALERCVHPEIEVVEPPSLPHGGRWKGREGLRKMMETRQSVWDNTFDGFEYWDACDAVIVYQIVTARAKSTGKTASFPAVRIHKFRDGKLSYLEIVDDTKAFLDTLDPETA